MARRNLQAELDESERQLKAARKAVICLVNGESIVTFQHGPVSIGVVGIARELGIVVRLNGGDIQPCWLEEIIAAWQRSDDPDYRAVAALAKVEYKRAAAEYDIG